MHGKLSLHCFHLQPYPPWRLLGWLGLVGTPLGRAWSLSNQGAGLLVQWVVAVSCLFHQAQINTAPAPPRPPVFASSPEPPPPQPIPP
jgi:hypothetical protein